jgi:hypothetical protein
MTRTIQVRFGTDLYFVGTKGLGDQVACAGIQRPSPRGSVVFVTGDNDERNIPNALYRRIANSPQELKSVEIRHREVRKDDIDRRIAKQLLPCIFAVRCFQKTELVLQDFFEGDPHDSRVVHNQNHGLVGRAMVLRYR